MLSIIICSVNPKRVESLLANIKETAGDEYELLVYENRESKGLCAVYNAQAEKARYGHLCFLHEDVFFHTQHWIEKIVDRLQAPQTGVIGVMGGRYKSAFGLGWRDGYTSAHRFLVKDGVEGGKLLSRLKPEAEANRVICLDGAFLCCRKDVWAQHRFDETAFRGFHFYDTDFTFRVAQRYRNYVTDAVVLEHFSQGRMDAGYLADALRFCSKYASHLPLSLDHLSEKQQDSLEGYVLTETLRLLKRHRFPLGTRFGLVRRYLIRHPDTYQLGRNLYFGFLN